MNVRVGSPAPKLKLAVVDAKVAPLEAQAANTLNNAQQMSVVAPDVDAFLQARASVRSRGMLPSLSKLLDAAPMHSRAEGTKLGIEVHESIKALSSIYADGRVTENEMDLLRESAGRLRDVLGLFQPQILNMLPRDTRERLQNDVMGPVQTLLDAADQRSHAITEQVTVNLAWVQSNPEVPEYGFVDLGMLAKHGGTIAGFDRYEPGDMIAVPRSDGSTTLGIVRETGVVSDGANGGSTDGKLLVAEFLAPSGAIATKKLTSADVVAANPLKIGDCIDTKDGRVWVTGAGEGGVRGVLDRTGKQENVDAKWLQSLAASCASILGNMRAQGSTDAPGARQVNEPQMFRQAIGAGGHESTSPEGARGSQMSVCFFTYRGIGYADYNEDGAVMGVVPKGNGVAHETGFAGAFDQAGGAGHVEGQTGAASLLAAQRFEEAAAQIAHGAAPEATLHAALQQAHEQVKALGVGALSTFAATVVRENVAHIINCGDSAVMVYGKNGSLKFATEAHNLGDILAKQSGDPNAGLHVANVVTAALGGERATADYSAIKVEKGDVIVCVSDGVADANLGAQKADRAAGKPWTELNGVRTNREIGDLIHGLNKKGARSAEMTQAIIDYAKQHVEDGRGKKDNVTACVMRVT